MAPLIQEPIIQRNIDPGKLSGTVDIALRFFKFFGTSAKFWMGLHDDYDLEEEIKEKEDEFDEIKPVEGSAA